MLKLLLFTSLLIVHSFAFSAPSVSIKDYSDGEKILVYANEMDSQKTQLNYEYYFLNFCRGDDIKHTNENLGSILLGETTQLTPYDFEINKGQTCKLLCSRTFSAEDVKKFTDMIDRDYRMNFVIDNLPVLTRFSKDRAHVGLRLGFLNDTKYEIYNHLTFRVEVNTSTDEKGKTKHRIVGFSAVPRSIAYGEKDLGKDASEKICKDSRNTLIHSKFQELKPGRIQFSYDVEFYPSNKTIGSRLQDYKLLGQGGIHWVSLLYSCAMNLLLTSIIGYILKRTVGKDISQYNELRTSEEISEDRGWKQLSRDVFRPPKHPLLLSALLGTGIQIFSVLFLTLLFTCLGFIDQSARGNLLTTVILFYAFMGTISGYFSARFYKMFQGPKWLKCTLVTAVLYPSVNLALFYTINHILISNASSNALRFLTAFELVGLWFGVSIPLVFLGGLAGYKKTTIQNPSKFNPIPKFVRPMPWYLRTKALAVCGGILPFGSIFIELMFVMTSVWEHSFYYLFSYLFAVLLILVITSAEVSIVITYLHLCNGNHRTWWSSFFNTGSVGLYIFAYSIFYFGSLSLIGLSSIFIYFGYMLALSLLFTVFCGTIGFLASYWFTKTIYASIRID